MAVNMLLKSSSRSSALCLINALKTYATLASVTPPQPPVSKLYDSELLAALSQHPQQVTLSTLITQYLEREGKVLEGSLPYESRPPADRRVSFNSTDGLTMVAHCVRDGRNQGEHRISVCSGFALDVPGRTEDETFILTCAHTLEQIRCSPLLLPEGHSSSQTNLSGTYVLSGPSSSIYPVTSVRSALRRSDLIVLSTTHSCRTLPVSPYPAHPQAPVRAHFVVDHPPTDDEGWTPWVGGAWGKWVSGVILGYRDFAGREAQPGTYDALSHMLFRPPPSAGSSGGPIVDEETGAVVGVMLGTRMDNRVEGVRGWGVPAETIFEMFRLPGLKLKSQG